MALLLAGAALGGSSCADGREVRSRRAVRQLGEATPSSYDSALAAVLTFGSFALADIEQQLHEAEPAQRLYLLEALDRIGSPEAVPLLRFWGRWGDDTRVRDKARGILERLTRQ